MATILPNYVFVSEWTNVIDRLIAINEGNFILKKGDDINKVWQIGRLNILFYHISNKKIMQKILLKDAKAGQKVTEYKNAMAVYLVTGNEPQQMPTYGKITV